MTELRGKGMEKLKAELGIVFDEYTYGADEREYNMMRHQILAEIHKSGAPTWVAEELEKGLYCQGCWIAVADR